MNTRHKNIVDVMIKSVTRIKYYKYKEVKLLNK